MNEKQTQVDGKKGWKILKAKILEMKMKSNYLVEQYDDILHQNKEQMKQIEHDQDNKNKQREDIVIA